MSSAELADFLRRRRESLRPDRVPAGRRARRTPGLRREEVAALAGVSTSYYERLERARAPHPSPQVLAALGTALRLTATEREHLARLAGQTPPGTDRVPVPENARRMLDRLGSIPAYLVDGRENIVAWNAASAAVLVDFGRLPPPERSTVRISLRLAGTVCTAPPGDEAGFARQTAATLRAAGARHPADRVIAELVDEFARRSPEFAAAWRDHDVRPRPTLRKHVDHPELGRLEFDSHTLLVPGTDLRLVMYTAEPGSPTATALDRLAGECA